jgi:hypothetical protein
MFTSAAANRIEPQKGLGNRLGNRGATDFLPAGLALTQIVSGVMENWDDIERQMPWYKPPQTNREPVRQQMVQEQALSHKPLSKEEKARTHQADPNSPTVEAEEGEKLIPTAVKGTKKAQEQPGAANAEKPSPEKTAEASAQAALSWRAPEMPKVEGQAVPASFAVPNHSAGASGFGNTWSHAAKASGGENNVIHSE